MNPRALWAGGAVALLGLGAILLAIERAPSTPPAVPRGAPAPVDAAPTPTLTTAPATGAGSTTPSSAAAAPASALDANPRLPASVPLPARDAPLASVIAELEQRARGGDARAACRLAADLSRCAQLPRRREFRAIIDPLREGGDRGGRREGAVDWQIDATARLDVALEDDERLCEGITREQSRRSIDWLYRAAQGGQVPAMAAFASGNWMATEPAFIRQPELVAAFARDAARMATAALDAGDRSLLVPLGLAYAGRGTLAGPLGELVEPDAAKAHALLQLASESADAAPLRGRGPGGRRMAQGVLAELDASLDPSQRAASQTELARLRAAQAKAPAAPSAGSGDPLTGLTSGLVPAAACEN
jgi:hypothetical protein